jgi:aminopeptidase N
MESVDLETNNIRESIGQIALNYPPSVYFRIDQMWLSIEPDFKTKRISGKQQLKITTLKELEIIELDCDFNEKHKIEIDSMFYSDGAASVDDNKKLDYSQYNDKLAIKIGERLSENSKFYLIINYSTNGTDPPDGFVFIDSNNSIAFQAWTQGEAVASKKWFPCIDHPQIKFPRELSVIVPENFIVISNGEREILNAIADGEGKKKYVWEETHPNTSYVTSVVIGDFAQLPKENYNGRVPLLYYVPHGRENDGKRLFKNTSKMMEFFESYLQTKYPYDKYAQVTVEEFGYGGMENTTCTTLTTDILPDEKTVQDSNTYDYVIVHELAHQWFGDLVTCRDWQHIWLNESFASYSEALYYQNTFGDDEFYNYMLGKGNAYLNHTEVDKVHKIPLVTKKYNNPLEMFIPPERIYEKGAWIVHMLRSLMGDEDFKNSLKIYFDSFKFGTAETENIRQIFEQVSGMSLQKFFDQWIYQAGHPELNVIGSFNNSKINLKIQQTQDYEFDFPFEILIVYQTDKGIEKKIEDTILISNKEIEKTYDIPNGSSVKRFVIDPYYKILSKLNFVIQDSNNSILLNSLTNGETFIEKIRAAIALKNRYLSDLIDPLKTIILQENLHWGIRVEVAKVLQSIKTEASYKTLIECLKTNKSNKVKESIVESVGSFSKTDSFDILKNIIENQDENDSVIYATAIAIAQSKNEEKVLPILTNLLEKKSYKNIIARGAIEGLKIIALESTSKEKIDNIESILLEKSKIGNDSRIRQTSISALGYLARYYKERTNIVDNLKNLLNDKSIHLRNTAYTALGNAFEYSQDQDIMNNLSENMKREDNEFVKQTAETSITMIKKSKPLSSSLTKEKGMLKERKYKSKIIDDLERHISLH